MINGSDFSVLELFQPMVAGPVLPATILLGLLLLWGLMTIVLGVAIDLDSHTHGFFETLEHLAWDGLTSVTLVPMRWLNLRDVPLIVWLSIFSIVWWSLSFTFWLGFDRDWLGDANGFLTVALVARNLLISLPITKVCTQPLRGWINTPPMQSKSLIGQEAEISSYEASPEGGQAKYKTGAAPLLLNVKTDGPHLSKGTRVWITHYDLNRKIYIVSATTTSSQLEQKHVH
jgi:Protein of unknown function (DUF1449)